MSENPFWSFVYDVNSMTGSGLLPYEPLAGVFKRSDDERHGFEIKTTQQVSINAICLWTALDGDRLGRLELDDLDKHRALFQFVSTTHLGMAIGKAAALARRSVKFIPSFAESTRLPEFVEAASAWLDAQDMADRGWENTLKTHWHGDGIDELADDYFFKLCLSQSPSSTTFAEALNSLMSRRKQAAEKTPVTKKKPGRFKSKLTALWLPAALWCRTPSGILEVLEPSVRHDFKDVETVTADLSRLRLTKCRATCRESVIEIAEAEFRQLIGM